MLSVYPSLCEHQPGSQCLCCNFQVNALLPAAGRRCPGPGRVKSVSVGCCMIQTDSGPGVRHVVCRVMVCDVIMSTQYPVSCSVSPRPSACRLSSVVNCPMCRCWCLQNSPISIRCQWRFCLWAWISTKYHGASVFILWYLAEASLSCKLLQFVRRTVLVGCLSLFR